jgi:hypothetical protein
MSLAIIHPVISPEAFWLINAIILRQSLVAERRQRQAPEGCSDLPSRSAPASPQLRWLPAQASARPLVASTNKSFPRLPHNQAVSSFRERLRIRASHAEFLCPLVLTLNNAYSHVKTGAGEHIYSRPLQCVSTVTISFDDALLDSFACSANIKH